MLKAMPAGDFLEDVCTEPFSEFHDAFYPPSFMPKEHSADAASIGTQEPVEVAEALKK